MKSYSKIALIAVSILLVLGTALAQDCSFGSKVLPGDPDIGRLLKNIDVQGKEQALIGFWDIGPNPDIYDAEDIVYLDLRPTGVVNANDVRLTSYGDKPPGSKVTAFDNDIGKELKPLKFAYIGFLNLEGSELYDIEDPVYLHQNSLEHIDLNFGSNVDQQFCEGFINFDTAGKKSCCGKCAGAITIKFTDKYSLCVFDEIADPKPMDCGVCDGKNVEVIKGTSKYYYHICGTNKLKILDASLSKAVDSLNKTITSDREYIGYLTNTVNNLSKNSQHIVTNDVRLNTIGSNCAGTKVLDFDLDHNKLLSNIILVTFPAYPKNLGAIRYYDTNGNGIYDDPDDIYLDISMPGDSPIGQVSINDVRLTQKCCAEA